jgi:hypothetical protein
LGLSWVAGGGVAWVAGDETAIGSVVEGAGCVVEGAGGVVVATACVVAEPVVIGRALAAGCRWRAAWRAVARAC